MLRPAACEILEIRQGGGGLGHLSSRPSCDGLEKALLALEMC